MRGKGVCGISSVVCSGENEKAQLWWAELGAGGGSLI